MKLLVRTVQNLLAMLLLMLSLPTWADEILIAVASNFAQPMEQIIARFEEATPHAVEMAIGSSGRFYAQIVNGAPFQIFFSADQDKIEQLVRADLTVSDSQFTYAIGRLALWSSNENFPVASLEALNAEAPDHLAIANPRLAPYGAASVEVLEALELLDSFKDKMVQGENIAQTFQYVDTGNVELGFVALSQVFREGEITRGKGIKVPENMHSPIRQDAVLLKRGEDCSACEEFLQYIQSDEIRSALKDFGYQ